MTGETYIATQRSHSTQNNLDNCFLDSINFFSHSIKNFTENIFVKEEEIFFLEKIPRIICYILKNKFWNGWSKGRKCWSVVSNCQ